MEKECCEKIKHTKSIKDICSDCIKDFSYLAETVGYEREAWAEVAIQEIETDEDKFYCISMKKLTEIIIKLSDKSESLEYKLSDLFNDIKYALHDIQAPVRAIRSFSEIVLNSYPECDSQTLDYLNRMHSASIRVTDMLNDVRDIMILGKRKSETKRIINFNQIIKDVQDNLHDIINSKNSIIILDTKNAPKFKSNILRWTRIFQNLILNSILYNNSENPTINIWFDSEHIYIQDNGIGIPENKFEKVFELFTRLTDRQNMFESGTGAGLFMCRKFLNMDDFTIHIQESNAAGTIFVITLPEKNS